MPVVKKIFLIQQVMFYTLVVSILFTISTSLCAADTKQNRQESILKSSGDESIKHYQSLIKENPQVLGYYNNLAVLYARRGDLKSARGTLEQGLNARADVATLYNNLNTVYLEMSRKDYASALRLKIEPRKVNLVKIETTDTVVEMSPKAKEAKQAVISEISKDTAGQEQIINMVQGWASAWSAQEVELYLSFYSDRFKPEGTQSRKQWAESRRIRLKRPSWVSVKVSEFTINSTGQQMAKVIFNQEYRSSNYSDRSRKELLLEYTDNGWQIIQEHSL